MDLCFSLITKERFPAKRNIKLGLLLLNYDKNIRYSTELFESKVNNINNPIKVLQIKIFNTLSLGTLILF